MAPEAFAFPLGEEMVEEVPDSKRIAPGTEETQPPNVEETQVTNQATIESMAQGGTESSCSTAQTSALLSDADRDKSLEHAAELMARGSTALKECDFSEATECFSRALEIRSEALSTSYFLAIFIYSERYFLSIFSPYKSV